MAPATAGLCPAAPASVAVCIQSAVLWIGSGVLIVAVVVYPVSVLVLVGVVSIAVLIDSVVPDFFSRWIDLGVGIVAIISTVVD